MIQRGMTRRSLLLAAPAAAVPANERIGIGFLGVKHTHGPGKLAICRKSPDWEVVGLWEPDSSAAARFGGPALSRDEILKHPRIQVIAVQSDIKTHGALGIAALEAGKHVHVEKPPADNMAELRRMVELARNKKRLLQMGYMWRHHPGMHSIFEAVHKGWLGDVYMIRGQMNTLIESRSRVEWARFQGGQMFEQGCHLIDAMVRLMGKPAKITPFLRHDGNFPDTLADNTAAVFEWARCIGVITHSVLQPNSGAHRMFEVMGTNGTATLRPIEGPAKLEIDLAKPAGPYAKGRQEVKLRPYSRFADDFDELARCVRSGAALNVTLEQELDVQEAMLTASRMV